MHEHGGARHRRLHLVEPQPAGKAVGTIYLVGSCLLGAGFIGGAVLLYRRADRRSALKLYLFSLLYLALLFATMVADARL